MANSCCSSWLLDWWHDHQVLCSNPLGVGEAQGDRKQDSGPVAYRVTHNTWVRNISGALSIKALHVCLLLWSRVPSTRLSDLSLAKFAVLCSISLQSPLAWQVFLPLPQIPLGGKGAVEMTLLPLAASAALLLERRLPGAMSAVSLCYGQAVLPWSWNCWASFHVLFLNSRSGAPSFAGPLLQHLFVWWLQSKIGARLSARRS